MFAPAHGDEIHQGLAALVVHETAAHAPRLEFGQGRHAIVVDGVTNVQFGGGVPTQGQIFGHAFHEPEGIGTEIIAGENIKLKGVHDFVTEHVTQGAVIAVERYDDATSEKIRESPRTFPDGNGHYVRGGKILMRSV